METRVVRLAIPLLLLFFIGAFTTPLYAQGSLVISQDIAQVVVADSAIKKEIPIEETFTTSDLPVYVPGFYIEEEKEPLTKKEMLKRFFTLQWGGLLQWFWTEPEINEKSESAQLLKEWEDMLGVNVFYAYFKVQEARKAFKEKCSFKICGMKATVYYRDGKIFLALKKKF
jgi:hypothetical protein